MKRAQYVDIIVIITSLSLQSV